MKQARFPVVMARRYELRDVLVVLLARPLVAELECGHDIPTTTRNRGARRRRCWRCPKVPCVHKTNL